VSGESLNASAKKQCLALATRLDAHNGRFPAFGSYTMSLQFHSPGVQRWVPVPVVDWWLWLRRIRIAASGVVLRPVYAFYQRRLLRQVRGNAPPRHVGLILDGNRRWGMLWGLSDPAAVYALGARKLDAVLDWCGELSIPAVTLFVCSTDNLNRTPDEVAGILSAVEMKLRLLAVDPQIHRRQVRVQAIGQIACLSAGLRSAIRAAEEATAGYDAMVLTIAVAYGGREEIADAVRAMLQEAAGRGETLADVAALVTPDAIARHLYLGAPEPDLIIRTSGELRLSGFLLWQSAYSEFYFTDVLWPALRKIDFLRAVRAFQQRRRRFGR
jgi:short-chain Z-isoprenyl diphosphate synthase